MTTTIIERTGETLVLAEQVAKAGEGTTYRVAGEPSKLAKILHNGVDPTRERKLRLLIEMPPIPHTGMPTDLLLDPNTKALVGFLQPFFDGCVPLAQFSTRKEREKLGYSDAIEASLQLSLAVVKAVERLHRANIVQGDLSKNNLLVKIAGGFSGVVNAIDVDSMTISLRGPKGFEIYRTGVGTFDYIAPELDADNLANATHTVHTDAFAFSVIAWELIFGSHPYAVITPPEDDPPTVQARISEGMFPYRPKNPLPKDWVPVPLDPPLSVLPKSILDMFFKSFGSLDPRDRPDLESWVHALRGWLNDLHPTVAGMVVRRAKSRMPSLRMPSRAWLLRISAGTAFTGALVMLPTLARSVTPSAVKPLPETHKASFVDLPLAIPSEARIDKRLFPASFQESFIPRSRSNK